MQKRIFIDGCKTCPNIINLRNTFTFKERYFCKLITVELTDIIYTHPDCPLEGYEKGQYKKALEEIKKVTLISEDHAPITGPSIELAAVHAKAMALITKIVNQDFNGCDCEPFQPCEKCKTEWLPISEMKPGTEYWILDQNNITGKGTMNMDYFIRYNLKETPPEFGTVVMFAKIKPPPIK